MSSIALKLTGEGARVVVNDLGAGRAANLLGTEPGRGQDLSLVAGAV